MTGIDTMEKRRALKEKVISWAERIKVEADANTCPENDA
jgi:hypothetical protein